MEIIDYLLARKKAGGGSDVTIEQLSVTENGTYSEQGIAYSPVVVNVPAPENSYQLTDIPAGTVSTIEDGTDLPMSSLKVGIEPAQDLHGYDHPWAGGAGRNLFNMGSKVNGNFANMTVVSDDNYITFNGTKYGQNTAIFSALTFSLGAGTYYAKAFAVSGTAEVLPTMRVYKEEGTYATSDILNAEKSFTLDVETTLNIAINFSVDNKVYSNYKFGIVISNTANIDQFYPYSNICPIEGWTAANVTRTGKNIWGGETLADAFYGATSYIKDTNTKTVNFSTYQVAPYHLSLFNKFKANTQYTIILKYSAASINNSMRISYSDGTESIISLISTSTKTNYVFITQANKTVSDIFLTYYSAGVVTVYYDESGIFEGVHTVDDFEPYNGNTYTIQFRDGDNPLTVYGGTLDVTSGELVVDRAMVDLGTLSWSTASTGRHIVGKPTDIKIVPNITVMNGVCSQYILVSGNASATTDGSICMLNGSLLQINDSNLNGTDAESFKTAMSGVQLAYELATPTTYHLTPTQIRTLVGNNNIWADTGDIIEGKYFKSLS